MHFFCNARADSFWSSGDARVHPMAMVVVSTPTTAAQTTTAVDTCKNNNGRRLKTSEPVTFIKTVGTPTTGIDPRPCCNACRLTTGCDYYYLEYKSGADAQCKLYGLDDSLISDLL
jgi:hypothetical protein